MVRAFDAQALWQGRAVAAAPGADGARRLVGCGGDLPDQKIAIVDPERSTSCPTGNVGEIWVHGPSVAQGYWHQPEATEATFRAYVKDTGEGPFLRTGDLGFIDDNGELFVTGRAKDLIIVRGVNYYPQDIELTVQHSHSRLRVDCGAAFTVERDGRELLVLVQEVERHKQDEFLPVFAAICRAVSLEHDLRFDAIVFVKAGSDSKDLQRQDSASRLPQRLPGRLLGRRRPMAERRTAARAAAGGNRRGNERRRAADAERPAIPAPLARRGSPGLEKRLPRGDAEGKDGGTGRRGDSPRGEGAGGRHDARFADRRDRPRFAGTHGDPCLAGRTLRRAVSAGSLPELETTRHVIEAVEKYLGGEPRQRTAAAETEIPAEAYRIELFPECRQLRQRLDMLEASGVGNPYFTVHQGITNDRTTIGGRQFVNFTSYNYVGMSGDPAVAKAAKAAIDRYGTSVSASRLASGEKELHGELERAIARFLGAEAALSFVGGHATNETVIGHLVGPGDLVLHDALAHNSIVQGAILSGRGGGRSRTTTPRPPIASWPSSAASIVAC